MVTLCGKDHSLMINAWNHRKPKFGFTKGLLGCLEMPGALCDCDVELWPTGTLALPTISYLTEFLVFLYAFTWFLMFLCQLSIYRLYTYLYVIIVIILVIIDMISSYISHIISDLNHSFQLFSAVVIAPGLCLPPPAPEGLEGLKAWQSQAESDAPADAPKLEKTLTGSAEAKEAKETKELKEPAAPKAAPPPGPGAFRKHQQNINKTSTKLTKLTKQLTKHQNIRSSSLILSDSVLCGLVRFHLYLFIKKHYFPMEPLHVLACLYSSSFFCAANTPCQNVSLSIYHLFVWEFSFSLSWRTRATTDPPDTRNQRRQRRQMFHHIINANWGVSLKFCMKNRLANRLALLEYFVLVCCQSIWESVSDLSAFGRRNFLHQHFESRWRKSPRRGQ